jgi:putative DNA primase/helicase
MRTLAQEDQLLAEEAQRQVESGASVGEGAPASFGRFTDQALSAEVVEKVLAGHYLWTPADGWLKWNGRVWADVHDVDVEHAVHGWLRLNYLEAEKDRTAAQIDGEAEEAVKARTAVAKCWRDRLGRKLMLPLVALARGNPLVRAEAAAFDADPDLLVVGNGVVDLRTGEIHGHDPIRRVRKHTPVNYRPQARHADWEAALTALDQDDREYALARLGQAVTGYTPDDDRLPIFQGDGANGKTTIMSAVKSALGDYAITLSRKALFGSPSDHSTEKMPLRGARLAILEELDEGGHLNVAALKELVGTETITARAIRRDNVTWQTTHSLVINTNPLPVVSEVDHGTWRRLVLVPFPYTYVDPGARMQGPLERPGDPGIRQRMKTGAQGQWEAVLATLVEQAVRWYARGRRTPEMPPAVAMATNSWRESADQVMAFIQENVLVTGGSAVPVGDFQRAFNDWQQVQGNKVWSAKLIASRFEGHSLFSRPGIRRCAVRPDSTTLSFYGDGKSESPGVAVKAWSGVRLGVSIELAGTPGRMRRETS